MKKTISILLVLCLLAGFGAFAAAEEEPGIPDSPSGGLPGLIWSMAMKLLRGGGPEEADGEQTYTVLFADEDGNPVPGVSAAFCTAVRCSYTESDAEGRCIYTGPAGEYHVTLVEVPEGFREDIDEDISMGPSGGTITVKLVRE